MFPSAENWETFHTSVSKYNFSVCFLLLVGFFFSTYPSGGGGRNFINLLILMQKRNCFADLYGLY